MLRKYNEILCWGAQSSPKHHPELYSGLEKLQYNICLTIWRIGRIGRALRVRQL